MNARGSTLISILLLSAISLFPGCQAGVPELAEGVTVYFNDPLAGLPYMKEYQAQGGELYRALIEGIASASLMIDIAVHSISNEGIIAALNDACRRGVKIRVVIEQESTSVNLRSLPCVRLKEDRNGYLMHNKFMIVDRAIVWTGSNNWTDTDSYFNANNLLKVVDKDVAKAYRIEFEEMFLHGRYSQERKDRNEEQFDVGGVPAFVYFSPGDRPERVILERINGAKSSIYIAMFYYTNDLIHKALVDALARGVEVQAVWDFRGWENFELSEMDEMLFRGVGAIDANPGLVHHKFAVIDEQAVITGSANWSASGMIYNDENILIIHDPGIARQFIAQFNRLARDALRYDSDPTLPPRVTVKHYNYQDVLARIEWRPHLTSPVDFYEICRARSSMGPCEEIFKIPADHWYYVDDSAELGKAYYYRMRSKRGAEYTDWSNEYKVTIEALDCPSSGADEECDCDDRLDNDGDSWVDCDDYDCATATPCLGPDWQVNSVPKVVLEIISAEEAERNEDRYLGKIVTVRFYVFRTYKGEKATFLDSSANYQTDFTAVIFESDEEKFTEIGIRPAIYYEGKTVEVTGELEEYNGPEIILREPWQIEVIEE